MIDVRIALGRAGGWALLVSGLACGSDSAQPSPEPPPPETCAAPSRELPDGQCIRPGVPIDGCGAGFSHDGEYGCSPVLPEGPCFEGLMALPGDASCHEVAPCGEGTWGDIPVESDTVYVDASYAGNDSDGTARRPFTLIAAAVMAAPSGALVAIAEGTYDEDLVIADAPLRLWGRCPELVQIRGTATSAGPCGEAAVCVTQGGSELVGLSVEGPSAGVFVTAALDVRLEQLWLHDAGGPGLVVDDELGPASAMLRGSLVEGNREAGVMVRGAVIDVEGSVLRGNLPALASDSGGWGLGAQLACDAGTCDASRRASLRIVGSVVITTRSTGSSRWARTSRSRGASCAARGPRRPHHGVTASP